MKLLVCLIPLLVISSLQADDFSLLKSQGLGFADASKFPESQARLMAVRAARIDAQRNLLETINGVRVTSGTTVKDMALESDIVGTRVKGMLQGAFELDSTVNREEDSWVASVTMAVCLSRGDLACSDRPTLSSITQPNLKGAPIKDRFNEKDIEGAQVAGRSVPESSTDSQAGETVTNRASQHSGLILDASRLDISPMLDLRLRSGLGKELYGPGHVRMGTDWLHWASSVQLSLEMADIIGENPLVIEPIALGGESELIVGNQDAIQIFISNTLSGDYLSMGRVVIVVSNN